MAVAVRTFPDIYRYNSSLAAAKLIHRLMVPDVSAILRWENRPFPSLCRSVEYTPSIDDNSLPCNALCPAQFDHKFRNIVLVRFSSEESPLLDLLPVFG